MRGINVKNPKLKITVILIIQLIVSIGIVNTKSEFHIDEIYSYILSNSYSSDKISDADWIWGKWVSGNEFDDFITVQDDEKFSFEKVYMNNSNDCHPPLYYWLLHFVCSLFPGKFSKWFGCSLNIVIYIISSIFLYLVADKIIKNEYIKWISVVAYSCSVYALNTCMYIRMYMLLTLITLMFTYCNLLIYQNGITVKKLLILFILAFIGAMTHYYFVVLLFWEVLWLIAFSYRSKKFKISEIIRYIISNFTGVGLMLIVYPYAIEQATGSETNNVGNEVVRNLFNLKLWIKQLICLSADVVSHLTASKALSIICVGIILVLLFAYLVDKRIRKNDDSILFLLISVLCVFVSITYIGGEYVYERYIYNIIPLIVIVIFGIVDSVALCINKYATEIGKTLMKAVSYMILLAVLSNTICGIMLNNFEYSYIQKERFDKMVINTDADTLLVVTDENNTSVVPTSNIMILRKMNNVYMQSWEYINENKIFNDCVKNGSNFLLYITTDDYWVNGYDSNEILKSISESCDVNITKICDYDFGIYYLVNPKISSEIY